MKKILILGLVTLTVIASVLSFAGCGKKATFLTAEQIADRNPGKITGTITLQQEGGNSAIFEEGDATTFTFELYYEQAPITVTNFVKRVKEGIYTGSYSVGARTYENNSNAGYVWFGGDKIVETEDEDTGEIERSITSPNKGTILGEFADNGWNTENPTLHTKGVFSMVLPSGANSASTMFSVNLGSKNTALDGKSATFGKITNANGNFYLLDELFRLCTSGSTISIDDYSNVPKPYLKIIDITIENIDTILSKIDK